MSKRKSLSEQLAEIANPAPSIIDPEDEYNEDTKARLDRYDEEYEVAAKPVKKALKAKPSLRQSNAQLLSASDKRYAGTKVSRRDLEEDFQEPDMEDSDEEESEAEEIEEFNKKFAKLGSASKSQSIQGNKNILTIKSKASLKDSDDDEDDDIDEASEDESDFEDSHNGADSDLVDEAEEVGDEELDGEDEEVDDEDMDEQDEEAEDEEDEDEDEDLIEDIDDNRNGTLNDEEDAENIKKENKRRIDADVKKGSSIKQQLSLWDLLLECRIKYHKTISHCNRLPQGASGFKSFTQIPGENDFVKAALAAQSAIKTFLDSSLELQELLLKSNPSTKMLVNGSLKPADADDEEIPSDSEEEEEKEEEQDQEPRRKKLKLEEYEREIDKRHQNYRDFCNRTLHVWNEKTRGRAAGSQKSGFDAFDASILKQIEGILSDKQRLLNRTRTKRSTYRILGMPEKKKEEETQQPSDETPLDGLTKKDEDDLDPEIYDDDDFYHQLLRELIEKRTSEGGSNQLAVGRQLLEIQKLRAKAKRKVDSKASKGRRLRYHVHPKLVSFMAPFPETSWNDMAKNELFSSLFSS